METKVYNKLGNLCYNNLTPMFSREPPATTTDDESKYVFILHPEKLISYKLHDVTYLKVIVCILHFFIMLPTRPMGRFGHFC